MTDQAALTELDAIAWSADSGFPASLLDAAELQPRGRGVQKLTLRVLSSNEAATRRYERHGFTREGTPREEFRINGRYVDDVLMAKRL